MHYLMLALPQLLHPPNTADVQASSGIPLPDIKIGCDLSTCPQRIGRANRAFRRDDLLAGP